MLLYGILDNVASCGKALPRQSDESLSNMFHYLKAQSYKNVSDNKSPPAIGRVC